MPSIQPNDEIRDFVCNGLALLWRPEQQHTFTRAIVFVAKSEGTSPPQNQAVITTHGCESRPHSHRPFHVGRADLTVPASPITNHPGLRRRRCHDDYGLKPTASPWN